MKAAEDIEAQDQIHYLHHSYLVSPKTVSIVNNVIIIIVPSNGFVHKTCVAVWLVPLQNEDALYAADIFN